MTTTYDDQIRADTILDLATGLIRVTADIMTLHGSDPDNTAIVAAAFKMALTQIGTIYPEIPLTVATMVKEDAARAKH